jgi:dipeptidyl aminopeptidase/acylaminoacyl peptidase
MEAIDRLSVISTEDGTIKDLNVELDRSVGGYHWTSDSSGLIFFAGTEGIAPIYHTAVENGEVTTLARGEFKSLWLDVGKDGEVAFVASKPDAPPELYWLPAGEDQYRQMTEFNQAFLDEVYVQPMHELWFTTPSGNRIQGWYMLPVGYEEGKQYPMALHIHGGPHVMWGPSQESMFHEWQTHAGEGYVVFYCNPRGAAGYGESFQKALHGGWGEVAYEDIMAGVDALLEKGFVDESKMAVTGGSYGGYMTAWIVSHNNRFQCAVSQRGVYNLISFTGTSDVPSLIFGEFDVYPWEDHDLLWRHSPVAYAHQIKTPLLIIHSENDFRVPIEQAEQLFSFVRYSGGTVEMWRYPREGHELSRSGEPEHRMSRLRKMTDWFNRYCKPSE